MEYNTKIILWAVGGILVGGTLTYIFVHSANKNKKNNSGGGEQVNTTDTGATVSNEKLPSSGFPLALLAKGKNVVMAQVALNMSGKNVAVDGVWGKEASTAADWMCVTFGANYNPYCKLTQSEFDKLMDKAGGKKLVIKNIANNQTYNRLYNSYQ